MVSNIYCPKCKRCIGYWDGKSKINNIRICHYCNKRIICQDGVAVKVTNIESRKTSSGVTFGV